MHIKMVCISCMCSPVHSTPLYLVLSLFLVYSFELLLFCTDALTWIPNAFSIDTAHLPKSLLLLLPPPTTSTITHCKYNFDVVSHLSWIIIFTSFFLFTPFSSFCLTLSFYRSWTEWCGVYAHASETENNQWDPQIISNKCIHRITAHWSVMVIEEPYLIWDK